MKITGVNMAVVFLCAISACSQIEDVQEPSPITLSVVSDTKATALPSTDAIYLSAYLVTEDSDRCGDYFRNALFVKNGAIWYSSPVIYWPFEGYLDFLALAVPSSTVDLPNFVWQGDNSSSGVEIFFDNESFSDWEVLYAKSTSKGITGNTVPLNFDHTKARLEFDLSPDILVDSIIVRNTYTSGMLRITNGIFFTYEWIYRGELKHDVRISSSSFYIPEQEACDIDLFYHRMGEESRCVRIPAKKGKWYAGEIYKFTD